MGEYLLELRPEVEAFLFHEALLLDDLRFDEWLALFADEARYWMPIAETLEYHQSRVSAEGEWALVEETKAFMAKRLERMKTGMAFSEQPRSRTLHYVANVLVSAGEGGTVIARSNILVFQGRRDRKGEFFAGYRLDSLVRHDSSWLITERRVFLDQRVLPRALSVFL